MVKKASKGQMEAIFNKLHQDADRRKELDKELGTITIQATTTTPIYLPLAGVSRLLASTSPLVLVREDDLATVPDKEASAE